MGGKADQGRGRRRASDDPIAAGLRRLWQDVESEPVPDSFLDILDRIDAVRADESTPGGADCTRGAK
jgi:hypothetical protein